MLPLLVGGALLYLFHIARRIKEYLIKESIKEQ
jgi:hypothetical protein